MELIRASFPDRPAAGASLARILLGQVAGGRRGATLRIARTGSAVAFGRRDRVSPGYREAAAVAASLGSPGFERISGGRATAYVPETIVLGVTLPDRQPARRTEERFEWVSGAVREALGDIGLDARVGRIEGEYCPGEHSVNIGGEVKVAGIGQRMIQGAAHVGVVLTVSGAGRIREVLGPVYAALGLDWSPETAGDLSGPEGPPAPETVEAALERAFDRRIGLEEGELDEATRERAIREAGRYESPTGTA